MNRRRVIALALLAVVVLLIFLPGAIGLLTDWWWFREVGFQVVYVREFVTRLVLFALAGGLSAAILYSNLRYAQRGIAPVPFAIPRGPGAAMLDLTSVVRRLTLPGAVVVGVLIGFGAGAAAEEVLLAIYRVPFGIVDPVFSRDIGFYVFILPLLTDTLALASGLVLGLLVLLVPIYWIRGDIVFAPPRTLRVEPDAGKHLALLIAIAFVLTAVRLWFVDIPNLLYSSTGPLVGASYTDVHATLPALRLLTATALVAAGWVLVGRARGTLARSALLAVGGYVAIAVVARGVFPALMQRLFVAPTELTRETPYLAYHIAATRHAWGIDSVELRDLADVGTLTKADIAANSPTITNVRLWDRGPLLETLSQLQEIRTYYEFLSIDDDRYWIDGTYRQVLLAARELNTALLPTRTFINEHLTFTHGMGLTASPVNQVTTEGLPEMFLKDLPPTATTSLKVTRPQIYFGEEHYQYALINTRQQEFDHPSGEQNVYASYHGRAGVAASGLWRRLAFAAQFGTSKILFSGDITDSTRILYYRNIMDRAQRALPFLRFDRDPYLVVAADGTLKWIMDAYTASDGYPYAQHTSDGTTYMRNSVKVVIDAYDGTIDAYISAPHDPLIRTWARIFPGIFRPLDAMPADLRAHLRYPDDLYRVQTALYATYHMDKPEAFYQREDQWQIPVVQQSDGSVPFMRHIVMRLPEESKAEFIYMVPYTPRGKDVLAAWMVARNDGAEYGHLRVYRLPRQSTVFGPTQIQSRINQNTDISQQVSLWDQHGSTVVRGDLLVIPIETSLLYVQPLYLQAEQGKIPELKRVIIAYQDRVVMDETLDGALAQLFGGATPASAAAPRPGVSAPAAAIPTGDIQSLLAEARQHFQQAMQAQREGDWARYGDEIKALGAVLDRLGSFR